MLGSVIQHRLFGDYTLSMVYCMNNNVFHEYAQAEALLEQNEVMASPAELHGILCGLLCGGVQATTKQWLTEFNALVNDGLPMPAAVRGWLEQLFVLTQSALTQQSGLELLLPDEDGPLDERLQAISEWVQAFLAGFAVMQQDLNRASDELQEMIGDFSNITQLDDEFEEDEENEASYFVLYEHVKLGAMLAFEEFGQFLPQAEKRPTLH